MEKKSKILIDTFLKEVDFEHPESHLFVQIMGNVFFKKFGGEGVDYMNKRIGVIVKGGKGNWGSKYDTLTNPNKK